MTNRRRPTRRRAAPVPPDSTPLWRSWRHLAAYMYLFICFFDFVGMPVYYELAHKPLSDLEMIDAIRGLPEASQVDFLRIMSTEQRWEPLTLAENGLLHLAFGAILGVSAWTRGQERIRRVEAGVPVEDDFDDPPPEPEEPATK